MRVSLRPGCQSLRTGFKHRALSLRPRAGRVVSVSAADHACSLTVRLVGITRSEVSHAGHPYGVEEREDPEFWQCACEQQICSRPVADWQLSGERVRECCSVARPAPVTGVPALLLNICPARCVVFAGRPLHRTTHETPAHREVCIHGPSWCCSRSQFPVGVGHTPLRPLPHQPSE